MTASPEGLVQSTSDSASQFVSYWKTVLCLPVTVENDRKPSEAHGGTAGQVGAVPVASGL
jgi:hypothetical protein